MQGAEPITRRRDDQILVSAASFFTLAVLIHSADHVRRGVDAISRDAGAVEPRLDQLPLATAVRHPAVIAMVTGNLVILAISFAQL